MATGSSWLEDSAVGASEAPLCVPAEASAIFAWECDVRAGSVRWSENAASMLGCSPHELPADMRQLYFFAAPEDALRLLREYEAAVAQRQDVYANRFRGRGFQDTARDYVAYFHILYGLAGVPLRVAGIAHDVTERERLQLELRRTREELAAQLAASRRLHALSADLVRGSNAAAVFAEALAIAADFLKADCATLHAVEVAGPGLHLIASAGLDPASAAAWRRVEAGGSGAFARARTSGARVEIEDVERDGVEGEERAAYRRSSIRATQATPILARSGQLVAVLATHWRRPHRAAARELELFDDLARHAGDLLECAQTHAALRESEARFRAFVSTTSDAVFRMSADWTEMRALEGRGFTPDTLSPSGAWLENHIPAREHEAVKAAIGRAMQAKAPLDLEHRAVRADGTIIWAHTRAVPILDASGAIVEWFGTSSDITARKVAHERQSAAARISRRERQVLMLVAEGLRSKEIASDLGIGTGTVEVHRRNLMRKLAVRSVAGLIRFAVEAGMTPARDETAPVRAARSLANAAPLAGKLRESRR